MNSPHMTKSLQYSSTNGGLCSAFLVCLTAFSQRIFGEHRPLSDEMLEYAITDAHYLPFLAAVLRQELAHQPGNKGERLSTRPDETILFLLA